MRGSAVRNYYNSNRNIVYIMVIARIGNPIIPDTSEASHTQYKQLKKLSDEYGVDVTLFPAKGTQAYNDWYTNFPHVARSGIKIKTRDGSKTYQYPKEPTIDWLLQKMASVGGAISQAAQWKKVPRTFINIIKQWDELVDKGATITTENGGYCLRYGNYSCFVTECERGLAFNRYPAVADRLDVLYQRAQETARLRALAKTHGLL